MRNNGEECSIRGRDKDKKGSVEKHEEAACCWDRRYKVEATAQQTMQKTL